MIINKNITLHLIILIVNSVDADSSLPLKQCMNDPLLMHSAIEGVQCPTYAIHPTVRYET